MMRHAKRTRVARHLLAAAALVAGAAALRPLGAQALPPSISAPKNAAMRAAAAANAHTNEVNAAGAAIGAPGMGAVTPGGAPIPQASRPARATRPAKPATAAAKPDAKADAKTDPKAGTKPDAKAPDAKTPAATPAAPAPATPAPAAAPVDTSASTAVAK